MYVLESSKHNIHDNNNNVENNNNNNVENIRENNCVHVRAVQESRVVLVCQHLFNCQRKKNIFMQMYRGLSLRLFFLRVGVCLYTGY